MLRFFAIAILLNLTSSYAYAFTCREVFLKPLYVAAETPPVIQLRLWEQLNNQKWWLKPTDPIEIPYKLVATEDMIIRLNAIAPKELEALFFDASGNVRWMKHPLNESEMVPYLYSNADGVIHGFYSASRSLFVLVEGMLFSFKLPTDKPHPRSMKQDEKADLQNDTVLSIRRSEHIRAVDERLPLDDTLRVLTEVFSVGAKTGNGFSVRDLRPLQDGNYYLPAFSIPYFGREIAKHHGAEFAQFWGEAYAKKLGRAKAQFLLRYGLQMKTPNAQNWLIQLDSNMVPTGKIFVRDVADSNFYDMFAGKLGFKDKVKKDSEDGYSTNFKLDPNTDNSFWQMSEGKVRPEILEQWYKQHDREYLDTIAEALGLERQFNYIHELDSYLKSATGESKVDAYLQANPR